MVAVGVLPVSAAVADPVTGLTVSPSPPQPTRASEASIGRQAALISLTLHS